MIAFTFKVFLTFLKIKSCPDFVLICSMMFAFVSLCPDFGLALLDKIYLNRPTGNIPSIWQAQS